MLDSVQKRSLDALIMKADNTEIVWDSQKELSKVAKELSREKDG